MYKQLFHDLQRRFEKGSYAALAGQFAQWEKDKPLQGMTVLDATPSFYNTQFKYANLMAAGAKVVVGLNSEVQYDPESVEALNRYGIHVERLGIDLQGEYDVILDCGAIYRHCSPHLGFVELTRTGALHYQNSEKIVFNADDSSIKEIETSLGTGESFVRALTHLDCAIEGRNIVLFGYGKVGRGIAFYAHEGGGLLTVVDDLKGVKVPSCLSSIDLHARVQIQEALDKAHYVVCATGVGGALSFLDIPKLIKSRTILVNMGVENEFGPEMPPERVLNKNRPLNFILKNPTKLVYIDPTMALHNAGALELKLGHCQKGLNRPTQMLCDELLSYVKKANKITQEIERIKQWKNQF